MEGEEKVKEGERERGVLMGEKLKRGILVGKREGNSTPSPAWKFGLIQPDGTLIPYFNFSSKSNTLTARKLGANLWEMEQQLNLRVPKTSNNDPKAFENPKELHEKSSTNQMRGSNLRKHLASPLTQHNAGVENAGRNQQPLSPASYSSSKEITPHRSVITPNSSLVSSGKVGESTHSLKTSTELLKVLNRIWNLEEKHAMDMSLVKSLRRDLDQSNTRIQELMQDKKREKNENGRLMKQLMEYKVARKKEQGRIRDAVKLVEEKLEDELKLRKHSEARHHKLAKELSEIKSSFANALRELEKERKARFLLEDLCDAFAKGIRDYEQQVRLMKHKFCVDQVDMEGKDRLVLHISEAWLDERTQMKLADAPDVSEKQSALDKLYVEIEYFVREVQSGNSGKIQQGSKSPSQSNILPHSFESFHINEPASAPWNVKDEDDSIDAINHRPQFSRGHSVKQAIETPETKALTRKVQSRKASEPSKSQMQLDDNMNERNQQHVSGGLPKSRTDIVNERSDRRMPRKGEMMQKSSRGGKNRVTDADINLEDKNLGHEHTCMEGSFDPSSFVGPPSPVKKWTSEVPVGTPDISESSSRLQKSIKLDTLKAKLMEAREDSQQSRTRTCKRLSQGN